LALKDKQVPTGKSPGMPYFAQGAVFDHAPERQSAGRAFFGMPAAHVVEVGLEVEI
jgi:hypothetical protein